MNLIQDNSALSEYNSSSGSDNINENEKRVKKTRNRSCKSERFQDSREEIIKELNNIIGITEDNNIASIYKLEKMEILKNKLIELLPEVKKYYKCGGWGYVIAENKEKGSGNLLTLLKSIYENTGYKIFSKQKVILKDGIKERGTVYFFEKSHYKN